MPTADAEEYRLGRALFSHVVVDEVIVHRGASTLDVIAIELLPVVGFDIASCGQL